jgi:hypothetical protein
MMLSAWATVWWCVGLSVGLMALDAWLAVRMQRKFDVSDARNQARARRVGGKNAGTNMATNAHESASISHDLGKQS